MTQARKIATLLVDKWVKEHVDGVRDNPSLTDRIEAALLSFEALDQEMFLNEHSENVRLHTALEDAESRIAELTALVEKQGRALDDANEYISQIPIHLAEAIVRDPITDHALLHAAYFAKQALACIAAVLSTQAQVSGAGREG